MDVRQSIRQLDISEKAKLLSGKTFWTTRSCEALNLKGFRLSDGPHGLRVQDKSSNHMGIGPSRPAVCYPTASAMACSWNTELCEKLGEMLGEEAADEGVSVLLGPGLNIKRSPLCGRNFEYFSEDGYLSGKLSAAYVRGIQKLGTSSCIKHFAVNNRELGRMVCDCVVDERTLRETYLTGFEIAVKEGAPGAVMAAYNKINGVYCFNNSYLIRDILRGEWGFDGLVVSDWGGGRKAAESVEAGSDLEMPKCDFSAEEIISAVKSGQLAEEKVDECVERLCRFEEKLNETTVNADLGLHAQFAEKCEEEALVLLKNQNNCLPLTREERVAVIGDFALKLRYQGAGSSLVNPTQVKNLLSEAKNELNVIGYERGFERFGKKNNKLVKRALKLATKADAVLLCIGLDEDSEVEGADREHINIPDNQINLINALAQLDKKLVAVLFTGSAVSTDWDDKLDGLILAGLCGQSGAAAVVKAVTGEINPSGRLAESYIDDLSLSPCNDIYRTDECCMNYAEGIYVGYKYYASHKIGVKYPFGYGLSYTSFSYSDFRMDERGITFTVTNIGNRRGAVVPQMYIVCPRGDLEVNPAELKGFKKVFLDPKESKEVFIAFDAYSFRMWNLQEGRWEAGGKYKILLGDNCENILFTGEYDINGENLPEGCELAAVYESKENFKSYFDRHISLALRQEKGDAVCAKKGKKRLVADYSTEIENLKYCKGIVAKIFAHIASVYGRSKNKLLSNCMKNLPLRSLMQFMRFNYAQAQGFLLACNGHFFKGMKKIIFKK